MTGNRGDIISRIWPALIIILMTTAMVSASGNNTSIPAAPMLIEIPADAIKTSADGYAITYDHVKVVGDLVLDQLEYKYLKITNSIIEGNISASNATFDGDVLFTNTSFLKNSAFFNSELRGNVDFSNSRFHGEVNISQCLFLKGATFDYSIFDKKADFSTSDFEKFCSFYDCIFRGNAAFDLTTFNGAYANFESSIYSKNASFADSHFNTFFSCLGSKYLRNVDFHGAEFTYGSNFNNVTFLGVSRFDRSRLIRDSRFRNTFFNNTADFSSSEFDGPSFFNNAQFRGNVIFDSAQLMAPLDFSDVRFDRDLGMNGTKVSTMMLDNVTFNSRSHLFLAKADINRFMIKWETIKDILSFDSSAYLSLVKNYRDLGLSEADDCYYQYRYLSQESKSWSWSRIYDILAEITCGYGVRPDRPIICSAFLIIFCALIFYQGRGLKGHEDTSKRELFLDSLYYCLATFLEVHSEIKPRGRYRYAAAFLKSLSWVLFALLIGSLTKVMIG